MTSTAARTDTDIVPYRAILGRLNSTRWAVARGDIFVTVVAFVVLACGPLYAGDNLANLSNGLLFLLLCYAWNLVGGFLGELSMAHMIFWGIGGYGVALASNGGHSALGTAFLLAIIAALAGVVLAAIIRAAGFADLFGVAIFTLIIGVLAVSYATGSARLGKSVGVVLAALPAMPADELYLILAALCFVAALITVAVSHSRVGRRWQAIRDDVLAAEVAGINVGRNRALAYALSAFLCCLGGAYQTYTSGFANTDTSLSIQYLILVLLAVLIGGPGTTLGPLVGAVIIYGLQQVVLQMSTGVKTSLYAELAEFAIALVLVRFVLPRVKHGDLLTAGWRTITRRSRSRQTSPAHTHPLDSATVKELFGELGAKHDRVAPRSLVVHDVTKRFGALEVLRGVTFEVRAGEVVGIVGPNGAGKSTLCNLLSGVELPTSGSIVLDSFDLERTPIHRRAHRGVGRSFQTPRLFDSLHLMDNLTVSGAVSDTEARAVMEVVGVARTEARYGDDPDFYVRRLIEVSRAALQGSSVLILDEPLAGLTADQHDVVLTIAREAADRGASVIIVEHLIPVIAPMVDRMVVLFDGRVIADGAPAEILNDGAVIDAYLGTSIGSTS